MCPSSMNKLGRQLDSGLVQRPMPQVNVDWESVDAILFELDRHQGRRHLPIIRIRPAA